MTDIAERTAKIFASDVAGHEITVLRDDGIYRHVRFKKSDTGMYYFDLVTWPGCLVINGDMGSYTFSRLEDMFQFFRLNAGWNDGAARINPQYWAEKLRAGLPIQEYSEEVLRERVLDRIKSEDAEAEYPGLTEAVEEEIFDDWELADESAAYRLLSDFTYRVDPGQPKRYTFSEPWEMDLTEWSYRFLWNCHAIQWGIQRYDQYKETKAKLDSYNVLKPKESQ